MDMSKVKQILIEREETGQMDEKESDIGVRYCETECFLNIFQMIDLRGKSDNVK